MITTTIRLSFIVMIIGVVITMIITIILIVMIIGIILEIRIILLLIITILTVLIIIIQGQVNSESETKYGSIHRLVKT